MKIILKKDHDLLGDEGQVLVVKNGYARNFLIPNGIATSANKSSLKIHEEVKKQRSKKIQKLVDEANSMATELSKHTITFKMKTGEDDKVFGSVTAQMIFDELKAKGFEDIDRKKIILKEQIKSLGEHEVGVKLQSSVIANIKVNVVKDSGELPEAVEEKTAEEVPEA